MVSLNDPAPHSRSATTTVTPRALLDRACPASAGVDLARLVAAAVEDFDDLAVELAVHLARGIALPVGVGTGLEHAVVSLLIAVRREGRSRHVLVHADVDRARGRWEVLVHEDGRCTVDHLPVACAVASDLAAALGPVDVQVQVASRCGEGSSTTFRGRVGSAQRRVVRPVEDVARSEPEEALQVRG